MFGKPVLVTALAAGLVVPAAALSQTRRLADDDGAVTGTGTVVVSRLPDRMRLQVEVFDSGKSMKEAVANLKDRREAVRAQLVTLGAAKDSISFEAPKVNASLLEGRKQMEMMIRSRMGNNAGKKNTRKEPAAPSVLSAVLTADWPLKSANVEDLLVEISGLEEAVKNADLSGLKDVEKAIAADDEELREELEGAETNPNAGNGQVQPGTPSFVFMAKVPEVERAKALADAFVKAKVRAEATAKAAGAKLGTLRRLRSSAVAGAASDAEDSTQAYFRMMQMAQGTPPEEPEEAAEARGSLPGTVSYRVTLIASFDLNLR